MSLIERQSNRERVRLRLGFNMAATSPAAMALKCAWASSRGADNAEVVMAKPTAVADRIFSARGYSLCLLDQPEYYPDVYSHTLRFILPIQYYFLLNDTSVPTLTK